MICRLHKKTPPTTCWDFKICEIFELRTVEFRISITLAFELKILYVNICGEMERNYYQSDYLRTRENELQELYADIFNKIDKLNDDFAVQCHREKCDDRVKEIYESELANFKALISANARLLLKLEDVKAGNCDDVDLNLIELSHAQKKAIFTNQLEELRGCKHLGMKVLTNLTKELEAHQQREHIFAVPIMVNEHIINSHLPHCAQIANDINNEVQRLEKAFRSDYKKKLRVKHKFDKLDQKLASEVLPRLAQLERELEAKSEELSKTEEKIEESRVMLKEFEETEDVYRVKLKNAERDHRKLLEENQRLEKYVAKLKKGVVSHHHNIEKFGTKFDADLIEVKENAGINQRIKELEVVDLEKQLKCSKVTTTCKLIDQDATIRQLCQNISKVLQQISKVNATRQVFEKNLKILRKDSQ
jgi:hypothetical protein